MVKCLALIRRKPGLDLEDFAEHWRGPHAEIARMMPGLVGYIQNLRLHNEGEPERIPGMPVTKHWDGVAEVWWKGIREAQAAFELEPIRALLAEDRPKFLDEERTQVLWVKEQIMIPPPGWGDGVV